MLSATTAFDLPKCLVYQFSWLKLFTPRIRLRVTLSSSLGLRGADKSRTRETGISGRQRSSLSFPFSNFSSKTAAFEVVLVYLKIIGIQLFNHGVSTNSPREQLGTQRSRPWTCCRVRCVFIFSLDRALQEHKNLQLAETDHELAVGGTSGIGETSAREFVRNTTQPRVYLVGRSPEQASRIIQELVKLNPEGKVSFVKSDLSLLRNVDVACKEIQAKEDKVNLLFMTPGYVTGKGRDGISSPLSQSHFHLPHNISYPIPN